MARLSPLALRLGLATLVVVAIYLTSRPAGSAAASLAIGDRAPEFLAADRSTPILLGLDGRPIFLADLGGRPLWIVFWATWCTPCQQEAASIRAEYHEHADVIGVLAIDVLEPAGAVRDYALAHGLDYPIALDRTGAAMTLYRAGGLPSHVFLDGHGRLVDRYAGQLTAALMAEHLMALTGR